jgi:hypothetical protein
LVWADRARSRAGLLRFERYGDARARWGDARRRAGLSYGRASGVWTRPFTPWRPKQEVAEQAGAALQVRLPEPLGSFGASFSSAAASMALLCPLPSALAMFSTSARSVSDCSSAPSTD